MTPIKIIRSLHRVAGVALLFLAGMKIVSGFTLSGLFSLLDDRLASWFHDSRWIEVPLFCSFCLHTSLGLLRMGMGRSRHPWMALGVAIGLALLFMGGF